MEKGSTKRVCDICRWSAMYGEHHANMEMPCRRNAMVRMQRMQIIGNGASSEITATVRASKLPYINIETYNGNIIAGRAGEPVPLPRLWERG